MGVHKYTDTNLQEPLTEWQRKLDKVMISYFLAVLSTL